MKTYTFYLLTSGLTFWMLSVMFGLAAGLANILPLISILADVFVFSIAAPSLILHRRLGLIFGTIGFLVMTPYWFMFLIDTLQDSLFSIDSVLACIPIGLIVFCLILSLKELLSNTYRKGRTPTNKAIKIGAIILPIVVTILYTLVYASNWF